MKKFIGIGLMLLATYAATFVIGLRIGIVGSEKRFEAKEALVPNYTGQQVLDALNDYRKSKGLKTLTTDGDLCNNLVERYLAFFSPEASTEGHPGFDAWAKDKLEEDNFTIIGEVFSPAVTVNAVITGWMGSPGHKEAIENKEYNRACSYAGKGGVVLVLGAK